MACRLGRVAIETLDPDAPSYFPFIAHRVERTPHKCKIGYTVAIWAQALTYIITQLEEDDDQCRMLPVWRNLSDAAWNKVTSIPLSYPPL